MCKMEYVRGVLTGRKGFDGFLQLDFGSSKDVHMYCPV